MSREMLKNNGGGSMWVHVLFIAFVLLIPLMFMPPDEELSISRFFFRCVLPLMMVVVFYANYLWLVPQLINGTNRRRFYIINIFLTLFTCIIIHVLRRYEISIMASEHTRKLWSHGNLNLLFECVVMSRDILNLLFSILLAYSMKMTRHAALLDHQRQEAEVARRDAELKGLRLQLSPHFLLNTMNNIYALTAINAERAQGAILQLSQMLRHMLYDNQQQMVSLRAECDFIRSYVDLMKLRLASNVSVQVDINVSDNDTTGVAPHLFISLIENAFKHGVSSTQPSEIYINITSAEHEITCLIRNTNYPKTSNDRSGHGIGLQQVQKRLDTMYPGRYSWKKEIVDGMYCSEISIKP